MARRGRPPLNPADPSTSVHLRLTGGQYDRLYQQARQQRVSVTALIRKSLDHWLRKADRADDEQR